MATGPYSKLLFLLDQTSADNREKVTRRLTLDFSPVEAEFTLPDGRCWLSLETPVCLSEISDIVNYLHKIMPLVYDQETGAGLSLFYLTETRIVEVAKKEMQTTSVYIGGGVYGTAVAWASSHATGFSLRDQASATLREAMEFLNDVRSSLIDTQVRGPIAPKRN